MVNLFVVWLINAICLLVLPYVVPAVQITGFSTALVAALVIGLLNTLVRPVLVILTLPINVLTLGLFILVINGLLFWWVGSFLEGFRVSGFWSGVFGAIVYSLITWAIAAIVLPSPRPEPPR